MQYKRRTFLIGAAAAASALAASRVTFAQVGTPLSESDPQAQALGYKTDATKADKVKFPKYAAGQTCGSCQLYQGNRPTLPVRVRCLRISWWHRRGGVARGSRRPDVTTPRSRKRSDRWLTLRPVGGRCEDKSFTIMVVLA